MMGILDRIYLQMLPKLFQAARSGNPTQPERQHWVVRPNPGVQVKLDNTKELYNKLLEDGLQKSQNTMPGVINQSHEACLITKISCKKWLRQRRQDQVIYSTLV